MQTEITIALITVAGSIILASASYWLTKRQERYVTLRRQKLEHYKELVDSLNGVIENEATPEGDRRFSTASNNLNLIAPQSVILALQNYRKEISLLNKNKSLEQHDILFSKLLYEIRKDLGIATTDNKDFRFCLWAAGTRSKT